DKDRERLTQDQRRQRNRTTNRATEEIPVVRDKQDDSGPDQERAENGRENESNAARLGWNFGSVMLPQRLGRIGAQNPLRYEFRKLGQEPANSRAVRRTHRR